MSLNDEGEVIPEISVRFNMIHFIGYMLYSYRISQSVEYND